MTRPAEKKAAAAFTLLHFARPELDSFASDSEFHSLKVSRSLESFQLDSASSKSRDFGDDIGPPPICVSETNGGRNRNPLSRR